ncbi:class I SAM-dependent methyltransferase [Halosolutus gelatinilyticus]|uniref:class I SAM-dependent methyltransferase n=1 Tax=Halosolutus gelatinilyticus TaxID=2931975 RepID=UPI001FF20B37|nr:class I SAM-dependent methyltransferase [Halosolutus gelatinilyticus]
MDSNDVRKQWADRSGEFSPEYYAYYGPNETSDVLVRMLDRFVDRDAPVLELGCSSGRHLSHLHDRGFENLAGIEVNEEAFDVMADTYPDLADDGEFYPDAIENVVADFEDDRFGAIYSVETLQHLHPDAEWVFDELSRITADLLVTAENESETDRAGSTEPTVSYIGDDFPLYYRDWNAIFTARGFDEVDVSSGQRSTIRTFRRPRNRSTR